MEEESDYHPLPQPDEVTIREREDAMGAYLMMFAAVAAGLPLPIINLIASIVYYSINKSKSRFVHFHALHSLFAQIPTSILNAGLVFWTVRIFFFHSWEVNDYYIGYIWMVVIANLLYFIFSIIAAVKSRKGQFYYFLFFGRLSYQIVYRIKDEAEMKEAVNKPPA
ncbi:MAG TPA: DUF4870 domain-containing protein [Flavobacteriales bacterium]|nr:DUF4870 domain-containing protein [Flavobacteriales bacterium]HIA12285.1 DUF4870 domain-containing protein [Flavobacteriales bacterium]